MVQEYESTGEVLVELGSDQTSLHNPFNGGYYPVQVCGNIVVIIVVILGQYGSDIVQTWDRVAMQALMSTDPSNKQFL